MLIEFSVSNFRSFRERQTLSMVAAPKLRKRENVFQPALVGEKFPSLLKACVVYGPNASGKSNLLKALHVVDSLLVREPSAIALPLPVAPFRFDPTLAAEPSLFELHFIHGGLRYQFELAATPDRIVLERLLSFPKGKEMLLYERRYSNGNERYVFGPQLEGGPDLHETWRKLTAPKLLFLAQAVANSNEDLKQLRVPFEWLSGAVYPVLHGMAQLSEASQKLAFQHKLWADDISAFLQNVDVPISSIRVEREATADGLSALGLIDSAMANGKARSAKSRTVLTHRTALGEAELPYDEESDGTKNLIGFWLPWTTREPHDKNPRCVLIVDELDSSLHPKIVEALVAKHLKSQQPSQLIFTTHDTHLMDAKLLRRDQFWTTERDENGATQLRSIHDFEGREGEDIEKRYYEGRYRALPLLTGQ